MYVAGHAALLHLVVEVVAEARVPAEKAHEVQMSAGAVIHAAVVEHLDIQPLERLVVACDQLVTAVEHLLIAPELRQTDGGEHVGHVALILRVHHVVLPGGALVLGEGVLGLTVEGHEHVVLIQQVAVHAGDLAPGCRAALGGGHILDGMEAEIGEVRDRTAHPAVPLRAEGVRCVSHDDDAPQSQLDRILGRLELSAVTLHDLENAVVIAHHTRKVDRDDDLGLGGDGGFHLVVVHLIGIRLAVDHHRRRADMVDDRAGSGIGIAGHDDLVSGADAEQTERHLGTGGLAGETDRFLRAAEFRDLLLKELGLGAGRDPSGTQGVNDLGDLILADIRRGEGYIHHSDFSFRTGVFIKPTHTEYIIHPYPHKVKIEI